MDRAQNTSENTYCNFGSIADTCGIDVPVFDKFSFL